MRTPRFRTTIRGIMIAVLFVACSLGFWSYLIDWEARRVVMYRQRDVTRSIMDAAKDDFDPDGRGSLRIHRESDRSTYTTHWTERLETQVLGDEAEKSSLLSVVVSGANGRFSTPPINIETSGFPSDSAWLDRLLRAYQAEGWQYKVIRNPRH